jgi:hypothetical protein
MRIISVGVESFELAEAIKLLMDDAKASGVYCETAYIGVTLDDLRRGKSHSKVVEQAPKSLERASWMRPFGDSTLFADFSAGTMSLTFSRCPF